MYTTKFGPYLICLEVLDGLKLWQVFLVKLQVTMGKEFDEFEGELWLVNNS